ncbi:DUF4440 domain-containing protein [Paracoccus luteus]|uniref:DUF4440 domain-containing protein n=1 Tax=Paracoccus luteus TaxID=2508543 RepID=UPI00106F5DDD|nr:DUF4440 domain-containing protein [Paracoccus luteus]
MEDAIRTLLSCHEALFGQALAGDGDAEAEAALFAEAFIAASPAGVQTGRNNADLRQAIAQGYEHYRAIGTTGMRIRDLRVTAIDGHHAIAHVAWTATYARADLPEIAVDFDVHYLVQKLDGQPRIFGWIAGDEQALLKARGIT